MATSKETQHQKKAEQERGIAEMDAIYDRYVKPLEEEHWGEFVAVSPDGWTVLGTDREEVSRAAREAFGPGNFLFKVRPRVVGKWL